MKIVKRIIRLLIILAILAAAYFVVSKYTHALDGFKKFFSTEVNIDKTANVVEKIKASAEFTAISFYDEFVLNYTKGEKGFFKKQDRLVLICKGKVRAGFDLKKVADEDIQPKGDTLYLTLPPAEIFDIILNPSDFEYFTEQGSWSQQQETMIKERARERLFKDAEDFQILTKATEVGVKKLADMYKSFGFSEVVITVKDSPNTTGAVTAE